MVLSNYDIGPWALWTSRASFNGPLVSAFKSKSKDIVANHQFPLVPENDLSHVAVTHSKPPIIMDVLNKIYNYIVNIIDSWVWRRISNIASID